MTTFYSSKSNFDEVFYCSKYCNSDVECYQEKFADCMGLHTADSLISLDLQEIKREYICKLKFKF